VNTSLTKSMPKIQKQITNVATASLETFILHKNPSNCKWIARLPLQSILWINTNFYEQNSQSILYRYDNAEDQLHLADAWFVRDSRHSCLVMDWQWHYTRVTHHLHGCARWIRGILAHMQAIPVPAAPFGLSVRWVHESNVLKQRQTVLDKRVHVYVGIREPQPTSQFSHVFGPNVPV